MAKPAILCVDDEPEVAAAVERDIRSRYRAEYRVVSATSGADALETVKELKRRGDAVALLIADQRMPDMTGTEFLAAAMELYPEARKILLTAYADTEAAIESINTIGLDHYLMKPWEPPEQLLYPLVDDLLAAWRATAVIPYDGIRVAGALWSAKSHDIKDFLARNRLPYQWLDVDRSADAEQLVASIGGGELPIVFFPDGTWVSNPSESDVAARAGLHTRADHPYYDLVIVGGGPAGLGAAVYGASEGMRTLMVERAATGGQAGTSSRIENYLGFPSGLSGADLAKRATDQATRLGAEILNAVEVTQIRVEDSHKVVLLSDGTEITCKAILLAMGVATRKLEVPGIERVTGAGVYYGAALTEAPNYRGQPVFVVGGANSAGQGAMLFSRYASTVTMLVRSSSLEKSMSQYLIDQIGAMPNIDVWMRREVTAVHGDPQLEAVTVMNRDTGEEETFDAAAMFIFIGQRPHTDLVADLVVRHPSGFVLTGPDLMPKGKRPDGWPLRREPMYLETSVPGIFAAGDCRYGSVNRVATAVGQGSMSVTFVHRYLDTT
ncbi:MAG TPA: FAD-dependent oxidoreductase [Acidimicrobiia bacterium]|jgi:thioredoxin reductase (NADPH)|nr:FAD-dependent oxidoreductase [Acidimicrobiia bacterium]